MSRVTVRLGAGRDYNVLVGRGMLEVLPKVIQTLEPSRVMVIADTRLASVASRAVEELRLAGWNVASVLMRAGDRAKDLRHLSPLYGALIEHRMDRKSVVVALGGGVVGDVAGFVAGTYLRGIRWVGVPSTLVAQVDASIGGKTAVNHSRGKNLIGVFHQPAAVVCDTALLATLGARDRVSGFAEMVKIGLAFDAAYFRRLVVGARSVLALEPKALHDALTTALRWKARSVEKDERDTKGLRAKLNFGHTIGHALEVVTRYRFRHGEALVVGMRVAAAVSVVRGLLSQGEYGEIDSFLRTLKIPAVPLGLTLRELMPVLERDKKAECGKVRFVLLRGVGVGAGDDGVTQEQLEQAFRMVGLEA